MKKSVYLLNDLTVNDRNCTSYNIDHSWMRFPIINDTWIGEVFFFGMESFMVWKLSSSKMMNLCKCKLRKEMIYKTLKIYVPVYLLLFVYGHVNCAGQGNTKSPLNSTSTFDSVYAPCILDTFNYHNMNVLIKRYSTFLVHIPSISFV